MLKSFSFYLSILLFVFVSIFSQAEEPTAAFSDPLGRHYDAKKDEQGRTRLLSVYDSKELLISRSRFFYEEGIYPCLEEHDVLLNGQPLRTFSVKRLFDEQGRLQGVTEESEGLSLMRQVDYLPSGSVGRLLRSDGVLINYTYDETEKHLLALKASDSSFHYAYSYDDSTKNMTAKDLLTGDEQKRVYDAKERLIEEVQGEGRNIRYFYDALDRLIKMELPDQSEVHYHYSDEAVVSVTRKVNDQEVTINVRSAIENNFPLTAVTYQPDGQIASEAGHTYAYDSLFNRVMHNNDLLEVNGINQLIKDENNHYSYDYNGNLVEKQTSDKTTTYFYDALDRLIRFETSNGQAVDYQYDAFYRRIKENLWEREGSGWNQTATYTYLYDGIDEIGKMDAAGKIIQLRILNPIRTSDTGAILAIELEGAIYEPIQDSQGSIRALLDPITQTIIQYSNYTAFGHVSFLSAEQETLDAALVVNPWEYFGKRKDTLSGLIFFGRRYYDPEMTRWTTPDPLHVTDSPNAYAFVLNDPIRRMDAYGLFSVAKIQEGLSSFWDYLKAATLELFGEISAKPSIPSQWQPYIERIGRFVFGSYYSLMGFNTDKEKISVFGEHYLNEKVRVTFINGMLNNAAKMDKNLEFLSLAHGGEKIHYLFCPTQGWYGDFSRAIDIRIGYYLFGHSSKYPAMLASLWREQIEELGGVNGGGTIIHYAHSLGGTETDRARHLLTPEEQRMIRVITFGSATFIRPEGFQSVENHMSTHDFIFFLEPMGMVRNLFAEYRNLHFYGFFGFAGSIPLLDHLFEGLTYTKVINLLGQNFLKEFGVVA